MDEHDVDSGGVDRGYGDAGSDVPSDRGVEEASSHLGEEAAGDTPSEEALEPSPDDDQGVPSRDEAGEALVARASAVAEVAAALDVKMKRHAVQIEPGTWALKRMDVLIEYLFGDTTQEGRIGFDEYYLAAVDKWLDEEILPYAARVRLTQGVKLG